MGGSDVYKVGGKVFAICGLRSDGLCIKVSEIGFVARGHWVIVDLDDLEAEDAAGWIATSHSLVAAKLTRKARAQLGLA